MRGFMQPEWISTVEDRREFITMQRQRKGKKMKLKFEMTRFRNSGESQVE